MRRTRASSRASGSHPASFPFSRLGRWSLQISYHPEGDPGAALSLLVGSAERALTLRNLRPNTTYRIKVQPLEPDPSVPALRS